MKGETIRLLELEVVEVDVERVYIVSEREEGFPCFRSVLIKLLLRVRLD